jgi:hypothetical protein
VIRHVRFVRDHHRRVRRVALASDGRPAELAPRLAEHFIKAEIRRFGDDALEEAVAWAGARETGAERPEALRRGLPGPG